MFANMVEMVVLQGSLFDAGSEPDLRPLDGALERIPLDEGAWIDHLPGWVERSDLLFEALVSGVLWRSDERMMYDRRVAVPRLVATYGAGAVAPHPVLDRARSALAAHYLGRPGAELVTTGLCLYRNGSDSVAWHGDTIGRGAGGDTLVAIVSLGWPRRLHLRPTRGAGRTHTFALGGGDLLVMGGSCQRTWQHAVPKTARPVGPRVSVQFRPQGVS